MTNPDILDQSTTTVSHTGNTVETVLATYTIPAGTIGAQDILRIWPTFSRNASPAGNVEVKVRLGGLSGTVYFTQLLSGSAIGVDTPFQIIADNSTTAQKALGNTNALPVGGRTTRIASSENLGGANVDLVFTGRLLNAADTVYLENRTVEKLTP